jgi:DNA-binding CsgD family transcriptional regulator
MEKDNKISEKPGLSKELATTLTPATCEVEVSSPLDKMNNSGTKMNKTRWLRAIQILELYNQGYSQTEIAEALGIGQATVSRELERIQHSIRDTADAHALKMYSDYERAVSGLNAVQDELWSIIEDPDVGVEARLRSLSLLTQTYGRTMQGTKTRRDLKLWMSEARKEEDARNLAKIFQPELSPETITKESRPNKPEQLLDWLEENDE